LKGCFLNPRVAYENIMVNRASLYKGSFQTGRGGDNVEKRSRRCDFTNKVASGTAKKQGVDN